jgi:hypothetical protein
MPKLRAKGTPNRELYRTTGAHKSPGYVPPLPQSPVRRSRRIAGFGGAQGGLTTPPRELPTTRTTVNAPRYCLDPIENPLALNLSLEPTKQSCAHASLTGCNSQAAVFPTSSRRMSLTALWLLYMDERHVPPCRLVEKATLREKFHVSTSCPKV